ncbi:hypothetical protein ABV409_05795 [Flagellimonas sp. DF-77]|uniref:hypothetical protein n=1 Tax=Flagellimonas algarum TaxID=3230298 RepID=UPI0033908D22
MKTTINGLLIFLFAIGLHAQNKVPVVNIGDELKIASVPSNDYEYIEVPRKNIIMKRGGILNFSKFRNSSVIIKDLVYEKETSYAIIERTDKRRFFKAFRTLTVDIEGALEAGELTLPKSEGAQGAIVK